MFVKGVLALTLINKDQTRKIQEKNLNSMAAVAQLIQLDLVFFMLHGWMPVFCEEGY